MISFSGMSAVFPQSIKAARTAATTEHIRHVLASMHQMCFIGFRVNWLSPQGAFDDWGEKTNSDCVSEMAILKGINVTFWWKWNLF